jgi:hypothetical protein
MDEKEEERKINENERKIDKEFLMNLEDNQILLSTLCLDLEQICHQIEDNLKVDCFKQK